MASLDDYAMLVQIMDAGSLTAAAKQSRRSVQNVSRALARIEADLGVTLAKRTTRAFAPTPAGKIFLFRLRRVMAELERAKEELHEETARLAGNIKLSSSTLFGPKYVVPAITGYISQHPDVTFDLRISDNFVDPISSDVDVAVRIGHLSDSALVAKLLGYSRRVIVASSGYLTQYGEPKTPQDLIRHSCIVRTDTNEASRWHMRVSNVEEKIHVEGSFVTDSAAACNEAIATGLGIGSAQLWQVRDGVTRGDLKLLLTEYEPPPLPIHAVWRPTRQLTARTRSFVDFLAQFLSTRFT